VLELGAGLGILVIPSLAGMILLGSSLSTPVEWTIARVAECAARLGVAFWLRAMMNIATLQERWSAQCCFITQASSLSSCMRA